MKIFKDGEDFSFPSEFGFTGSFVGETPRGIRSDRPHDDGTLVGRRHGGRIKRDMGGPVQVQGVQPPASAYKPGTIGEAQSQGPSAPMGQQEPTISMPMSVAGNFAKKMIGVGQQMGVKQAVQGLAKATGQFPATGGSPVAPGGAMGAGSMPTGAPGRPAMPMGSPVTPIQGASPAGGALPVAGSGPIGAKHGGRIKRAVGGPTGSDPAAAGIQPGMPMPQQGGMPPIGGGAPAEMQPQGPQGPGFWRGRSPVGMTAPGQDAQPAAMKHGGHALGGKLTAKDRHLLPEKAFALPGERYPIHNENHARNALARVAQHGTLSEQKEVRAAVHRRFPKIGEK